MADRWAINASPLILLAKADILRILPALCDELVIPSGVAAEVQAGSTSDLASAWLAAEGGAFVRASPQLHPALARDFRAHERHSNARPRADAERPRCQDRLCRSRE